MRPNARTIRKILMRNRLQVLWGRRAFLKIRLPMDLVPEPMPDISFAEGWGPQGFSGHWSEELEDGTLRVRTIQKVYGGDPRPVDEEDAETEEEDSEDPTEAGPVRFNPPPLFVEQSPYNEDSFTWWEGFEGIFNPATLDSPFISQNTLDPEFVEKWKAYQEWYDKYAHGDFDQKGAKESPVLLAFTSMAARYTKTHYVDFSADQKWMYITYAVKWFYPQTKLRFAADLKKAFRIADSAGVEAKLLR